MLPFGLRSAPKTFNAIADALCWHLHGIGIAHILHYLDDYIIVAPPQSMWSLAWHQVAWPPEAQVLSIAEKELIPIILAGLAWGAQWQGQRVTCHCDNQTVVADF